MSEKYINSFIIKNAGEQEQEVRIKIPLEQVEGASTLKNEAEATARKLASLKEELEYQEDLLTAQGVILKETIPGTYSIREVAGGLDIYDNSLAEVKKVEGKTIKSKNLIPYPYTYDEYCSKVETTKTVNGITFTDNGDGMIIVNGTATADVEFMLKGGWTGNEIDYETCMVSGIPTGASRETYYLYMIQTGNVITEPTKVTYLTAKNQRYKIVVKSGTKVDNIVFKPMINVGETALPFEPHFKGLKSSSFSGIKSTGKNLCKPVSMRERKSIGLRGQGSPRPWDGNTLAFKMSAADVYDEVKSTDLNSNEALVVNEDGTVTFKASYATGLAIDAPCIGGKTYCFSVGYSSTPNIRVGIAWYRVDGTFIYFEAVNGPKNGRNYVSKTVPDDARWLCCMVQPLEDTKYTEITVGNLQLEEGVTIPTPYEPYKESVLNFPKTELPIGTTIDLEKGIRVDEYHKLILDGVHDDGTDYSLGDYLTDGFRIRGILTEPYTVFEGFSSIAPVHNQNGTFGLSGFGNNLLWVGGKTVTGCNTTSEFLEYLKSNPITLYYKVTTPKETPFTADQVAAGNEYRVFKGGTEQIIGNDAARWGADLILTQEYIVKPRGGSDGN